MKNIPVRVVEPEQPIERGAAKAIMELSKGVITVRHGDNPDAILAQWVGQGHDWDEIWELITKLSLRAGGSRA